MCDDLLDAYAAVDWAVAQTPSVQQRFKSWGDEQPYSFVEEPHPEMGQVLIKFRDVKQPPAIINAEVGAIINSIRSSLDILATTLANRHGACKPEDAYFPIARDLLSFQRGDYKGVKLVKGLPGPERGVLESLKPYSGGNDALVALHNLDITRKHRRLISVRPIPTVIIVTPDSRMGFPSVWNGFKNDAVIAWRDIDAPKSNFYMPMQIVFDEIDVMGTRPVVTALSELASLAKSIIEMFGT